MAKKNRNYYKANKFKSVQWVAKVENDKTKQVPTLDFTRNFNQAANDLKTVKTKINKELNNITKQINKIKKDSKTGSLLKNALVSQLGAYETARKAFLQDVKKLYNSAIQQYNQIMQDFYESLMSSNITSQGTATKVQAQNISEGDDADING
ncbi:MAG: hypothetical protein HFE81_00940 [Bacilli bacterium]|nr:hypothetical protein [Bacilli bacterium]